MSSAWNRICPEVLTYSTTFHCRGRWRQNVILQSEISLIKVNVGTESSRYDWTCRTGRNKWVDLRISLCIQLLEWNHIFFQHNIFSLILQRIGFLPKELFVNLLLIQFWLGCTGAPFGTKTWRFVPHSGSGLPLHLGSGRSFAHGQIDKDCQGFCLPL